MDRNTAEVVVMLLVAFEQKNNAEDLGSLIDDACRLAYSSDESAQVKQVVKTALITLTEAPDYYAESCPSCVRGVAEVMGMKVWYNFGNADDQWSLEPKEW